MYAVFCDGSRQHKVMEGQEVLVDFREVPPGQPIEFDQVVCFSDSNGVRVGTPLLAGAKVIAEVLAHEKGEKIYVQYFRRRKDSQQKTGHRQPYLRVQIKKLVAPTG